MGRYITGDLDYKFWFAVQSSADILEFGYDRSNDNISACIPYDDLAKIKKKVKDLKTKFKETFKLSYKCFMNKMDKKGYMGSSSDKETQTEMWKDMCNQASLIDLGMCKQASLIDLGIVVIKELNNKKDDLYCEAEC